MGDGKKRVATQAGVIAYGKPIGSIITPDMETHVQNKIQRKPEPTAWNPGQAKPGSTASPAAKERVKPKDSAKNNTQAAADSQLKVSKVFVHNKAPGSKVYLFSDSTGVFEDAKGTRSRRAKVDTVELDQLGWATAHDADKVPSKTKKQTT